MSGEGPESIPTSADPKSRRPTKRRALTPSTAQAASLDSLFARPDQHIRIPSSNAPRSNRAPPPEIVTNVQGSSAGAGSGEFHVYKASRRREYERLKEMDQEVRREKDQEEFVKAKTEKQRRDEEKTKKNRARRQKMKARKNNNGGGDVPASGRTGPANGADAADGKHEIKDGRPQERNEAGAAVSSVATTGLVIHDDD